MQSPDVLQSVTPFISYPEARLSAFESRPRGLIPGVGPLTSLCLDFPSVKWGWWQCLPLSSVERVTGVDSGDLLKPQELAHSTIQSGGALLVAMMWLRTLNTHMDPFRIFRGSTFHRTRLKEGNTRGRKHLCPVIYNPMFTGKGQEEATQKNKLVGASQPLKEVRWGGHPPWAWWVIMH